MIERQRKKRCAGMSAVVRRSIIFTLGPLRSRSLREPGYFVATDLAEAHEGHGCPGGHAPSALDNALIRSDLNASVRRANHAPPGSRPPELLPPPCGECVPGRPSPSASVAPGPRIDADGDMDDRGRPPVSSEPEAERAGR